MDEEQDNAVARESTREPDEWFFAEKLVRHHGHKALKIAALRAEKMISDGEREAAIKWLHITEAVRELQHGAHPGCLDTADHP